MQSTSTDVRFLPLGDTALAVEFGNTIDRAISDKVLALAGVVSALDDAIVETVPTFHSLLVQYDPLRTSAAKLETTIRERLAQGLPTTARSGRLWRLPACYHPDVAPDLEDMARRASLSVEEVVRLHSETRFHVYLVGFAPGFAYMGDLPDALNFPRRTDPRVKVPAGSVAIAQSMTGIYPQESPGGWHLIAHCPVKLFDFHAQKPALLAPGDAVRFEPVTREEHEAITNAVRCGEYAPASEQAA